MSWTTSDRRKRLPNNWTHLVAQTRNRANGKCQATRHHPKCDGQGSECDHITPGDNHTLGNLQWLNHHCHKAKTQAEVAANNARRATLKRRPAEQHPGTVNPTTTSGGDSKPQALPPTVSNSD